MKFSLITVAALAGSVLCTPYAVAAPNDQGVEEATNILNGLYGQIEKLSGAINSTTDSITDKSTADQKTAAEKTIADDIGKITDLVNQAKDQVEKIKKAGNNKSVKPTNRIVLADPTKDPKAAALAGAAGNILLTLQGTINKVQGKFGNSPVISVQVNKLVDSLSGLLLSLRNVLDNVLDLVKELLDGLLTGLSGGLTLLTLPKGLLGGLTKGLGKLPGYLGNLIKGGAGKGVSAASNGTVSAAANNVTAAAAPVAAAASNVTAAATNATSQAAQAVAPAASGVAALAGNATSSVANAAGTALGPIAKALGGALDASRGPAQMSPAQ